MTGPDGPVAAPPKPLRCGPCGVPALAQRVVYVDEFGEPYGPPVLGWLCPTCGSWWPRW